MTTNVVPFLVSVNGSVDVAATVANFESVLSAHVADSEQAQAQIGVAVNAVFDAHPGARIVTPTLKSLVLQQLNAQAENYKVLGDRVAEYVRSAAAAGTLSVTKGKGGGVARAADLPAPAAQ